MAKEYVPIYLDWLEQTQDLQPEEKGNLIDAVVSYASGLDYEQYLSGGCRIAFRFYKGYIDRNAAISEARSKAGSNKNNQNGTNDNKTEQPETNDNKHEQKNKRIKNKEKNKDKEKENEMLFDRFWTAYPRKVNKPGARRAFDKVNPDAALLDSMLTAISRQKLSAQWQENGGQYIPHPATWLNGRRWEDETAPPAAGAGRTVAAQAYAQRDYTGVEEALQDAQRKRILERMEKGAV